MKLQKCNVLFLLIFKTIKNGVFAYLISFLILFGLAQAEQTSLTQSAKLTLKDKTLFVELNIANMGDLVVYNVHPTIYILGGNTSLPVFERILPDNSLNYVEKIMLESPIVGELVVLSIVNYSDKNNMRHTNTAIANLSTIDINNRPIQLEVNMQEVKRDEYTAELLVSNSSNKSLDVQLDFVTPEFIAVNQSSREIVVSGKKQQSLPVILNTMDFKLIDSTPLIVIANYSIDGHQYSHSVSIPIQSIIEKSLIAQLFGSKGVLIGVVSFLSLLLIVALIQNYRKRNV